MGAEETAEPAGGTPPGAGLDEYEDLVHELARVERDSAESVRSSAVRLRERRAGLAEVRSGIDEHSMELAQLSARLRTAPPAMAPGPAELEAEDAAGGDADAALARARRALGEAGRARTAALRAGQRPTLLPRAHHVLRELVVYGGCMAACLAVQFGYLAASGGGEALWWVAFLLPVLAVFVGYGLVGAANRPRLPLTDRAGKPIRSVVPHNPRLGLALALCTMALFGYFAFIA